MCLLYTALLTFFLKRYIFLVCIHYVIDPSYSESKLEVHLNKEASGRKV